jgi:hypothetical protein
MTSGQSRLTPSPGAMPNSKCALSWNARLRRRQDDVGQQHIFGVQQYRPIQGSDHRYFDVEDV